MFKQQNINTLFQQISIPNGIEKGPRLSQTQTFLDQKDLITEQSLDRITAQCSQSQMNYDTPSPQQRSQQNTYKSQEGQVRSNENMRNVITSDHATSPNNFKQNLAIIKNPNFSNPQALYLGSDCFIENIQRSYPYSGAQSLESSQAVVNFPNASVVPNQKLIPLNGISLANPVSQISSNKPSFQLNLNQIGMQQQQINNHRNFQNFQQNNQNFLPTKENHTMTGIPTVVNFNQQQLQQQQPSIQSNNYQNIYNISSQIPISNPNQFSPIKFLVSTPVQQQITLQNQPNSFEVYKNVRQHSPNLVHKQHIYQGSYIQTNYVGTPNKEINFNPNMHENIQNSRNVSPDNQISNIHALNSKNQPNLSLISALNKDINQENTNSLNQQNQNTQNMNKFQVYNVQNVQKKLNQKTQNHQQQLTPYTITFGSSNNLNTTQSNNNNSSTIYQLLQPYQITNQSNNSQFNELSNMSKGSQQTENHKVNEINKPNSTTQNLSNTNVELNSLLSAKNQLSQFPQLLSPPIQNDQLTNNLSAKQVSQNNQQEGQNSQQNDSQQNAKNITKQMNEQQQYQFYPISMQRRGSQSQYMSPKESNSTALTSPIDIQVRQNKLSSCFQGESNHTTMRICEMSSTMNPLQIPSENVSQREDIIQNYQAQNSSYQNSEKYIFQNNNKSDQNQKQSDQSSVTIYQASSSQNGQSSNFAQSNNSLNSQKSGKGQQFNGLVQIKEEQDTDCQTQQSVLNKKQNTNQSSNPNSQIYYYKTNKQNTNEDTKKKSRKSNQSYDLASNYYNRIRQFNESSKEEKIELCLKGNHKQCLVNPRRVSLNKTEKSLDGSNILENNYNSSKCNSNSQLASSTCLNNSQNNKNILSKSKERNTSQEKLNVPKKPPKVKDSLQQIDNTQLQTEDQMSQQKGNEEKLLSLLSPSYKKVQQIQQLMKFEQEKLEKEKEKFNQIQENQGIFTFSNQRKQYQKNQTNISPTKQSKKSSPQSNITSKVSSPINKKTTNKNEETEQHFSETKQSDQLNQNQNYFNQESENQEEKFKKTSSNIQFMQKPLTEAAFLIDPYYVADKYLSAQDTQQHEFQQFSNNYQQNYNTDLQNQEFLQYHDNRSKDEIQGFNKHRQADNSQQIQYQQIQNQPFYQDQLNKEQLNQKLQNFSLSPDYYNNIIINQNDFQQYPIQNQNLSNSYLTNEEQTASKQINTQSQKSEDQMGNSASNKNSLLNQSRKGKLVNTIYIDMSEVSENGYKIPVLKGCSLTTTNSSYQNKYNQFQLLNSKDDSDLQNVKRCQNKQKNETYIDQDSNKIQEYPNSNNYNNNQNYQSPNKSESNLNEIFIFDTQFQTQEDLKSAQNLNQKNWSTLQGMNMVTVESQNGGCDHIQKFQFSPQTLQTEQGMYHIENVYIENINKKISEKEEENANNQYDNVVSIEKSPGKNNQRYSCNQNLEEDSPDNSYYYLQDSPQIRNKQIRPTIVPQLNLQKSFQNTLTTLNQNTSFNISQSPSSHKNTQQNFKTQLSHINLNKQQTYQQPNNNDFQNQENNENINYIQHPNNNQPSESIQNFKRHTSLSNLNQFQNYNNLPVQVNKQSTPVNNKIYLPTQPNSLNNSSFLNGLTNQKRNTQHQQSNSNIKSIQRNKSLGNIVGNVGYQSEEMGHEMFLTKKLKSQLNNHLKLLENRIKLLQREEEQIRKKAYSSKQQAENVKKNHQQVQEQHQNHHSAIEIQQKTWIETKKGIVQNAKRDHNDKIKKVMTQQQREKQEMARSVKFNSHINKSVADDLKQSHLLKSSEKKNKIKQQQLKYQEQRHLQQLYNQTSQMQQFLLKIKDEKVQKEELEQKITALEQLEFSLVEKLHQTYESNKQYLKNSNNKSQLSMYQSNFIDQQQQQQQQVRRESLQTNTEVINTNTNTSFTVFNQY